MRRFGVEYPESDGPAVYEEIPREGAYPGQRRCWRRLAEECPLVIVMNADDAHAIADVADLPVTFAGLGDHDLE
jgi:hypothetical protein